MTPVPSSGVAAELGAILERRAHAIELWDGPVQDLWTRLSWLHGQIERQVTRLSARERLTPQTLAAMRRTILMAGDVLERMADLEVEARAQVRGMDLFVDWAKQNSRIDAYLSDQFRLQQAGLTIDELGDLSGVA